MNYVTNSSMALYALAIVIGQMATAMRVRNSNMAAYTYALALACVIAGELK